MLSELCMETLVLKNCKKIHLYYLVTEALLFLRKLHNCDTQISVVEKTPDASALPPMTSK